MICLVSTYTSNYLVTSSQWLFESRNLRSFLTSSKNMFICLNSSNDLLEIRKYLLTSSNRFAGGIRNYILIYYLMQMMAWNEYISFPNHWKIKSEKKTHIVKFKTQYYIVTKKKFHCTNNYVNLWNPDSGGVSTI